MKCWKNISNFVVIHVSADGLVPLGDRLSADIFN